MKTTGRDLWSIPPGGFDTRPARRWIRPTIAAGLVLLLGVGGGALYASMKKSTAVSTEDAVAEFRAGAQARASEGEASDKIDRPPGKPRAHAGSINKGKKATAGNGGPDTTDADTSNASTGGRGASAGAAGTSGSQSRAANTGSGSASDPAPAKPEEGVYTWDIEGVERGPGVERRLPRRSNRIITYEEGNNWVEHHIFSEQKEQWFHLGTTQQGVAVSAVRNRVEMGPVEVDKTVTYDPRAYVSRFPLEVGQTWSGEWDGRTHGTYTGRTLDHTTIIIEGERVEVWVTEVRMEMRGDVEGTALTRSWVAPDYSMVVKQYQKTTAKSGPGNYYSEWEGQVLSLTPQR